MVEAVRVVSGSVKKASLNNMDYKACLKYQVVREEHGKRVIVMQCDFEDKEQFMLIPQNSQYRILRNRKDVTVRYRN